MRQVLRSFASLALVFGISQALAQAPQPLVRFTFDSSDEGWAGIGVNCRASVTTQSSFNGAGALKFDYALLADAMRDALHERYRLPCIPGALDARQAALEAGAIAVCLSGAGPGLMAFARRAHDIIGDAMVAAFRRAGLSARYWVLSASSGGARIQIG